MKISENITYVTDRETELIDNSALERETADRIKQRTLQLTGLRRKSAGLRAAGICAAVIALLACSVFAAQTTGLDYRLAGLFENGQSIDMGEAVQNLDESVEANGVKITAVQAMGDRHCAYVLYRVDIKDAEMLGINDFNKVYFDNVYVETKKPVAGGWYTDYIVDDGALYAAVSMDFRTDKVNRGSFDVTFKDLCSTDDEVLISKEWKVSIDLDYTPVSRRISSGRVIKVAGGRCRLKGIEISPISVRADFTRGRNVIMENISIDAVTLKSGENLADTSVSGGSSSGAFGRVCIMQFGKVVDIDDIESVTINGQTIRL